jgi:hypothetical protein
MALSLELIVGSDLTLDRDNLTIVRKFRVKGTLPNILPGDCFDTVSNLVMGLVQNQFQTYGTPMGTLYWNSIQLHEAYYAQLYEISVTYSPFNKQTGTYQVRVEHAAGTAKATAGTWIDGYPTEKVPGHYNPVGQQGNRGVIWNGKEAVAVDVPYNQTKIVIAYRHPQAFLNHAYLRAVGTLVGHPNNDTFLGYAPGEIAYAGGNATESECEASAEYAFEVSRNEVNLEVGGIAIAEKKGFDVISPVYKWDTSDNQEGGTRAIHAIEYVEIIRPRGREWMDYVSVFGWGG